MNARTKVKEAEIARMIKTLDELEAHYSPNKHRQTCGGSTKAPFHCKGCRGLQLGGDGNAAPVQCDGSQGPQPEGGPTYAHGNGDEGRGQQPEGDVTIAPAQCDGDQGLQHEGDAAIAPVNVDGGRDSLQHGAGTNTDQTNSVFSVVDWYSLSRPNWKDRVGLPTPVALPIHSCSQDPAFYLPIPDTHYLSKGTKSPPAFEGKFPFGWIRGYRTILGPVAMPRCQVNGYVWDKKEGKWMILASSPGTTPRL